MKPNRKRIRKLVTALRSGEYAQTQGALHRLMSSKLDGTKPKGHCCLGVACEVAIQDGLQLTRRTIYSVEVFDNTHGYLPGSVQDYYGFESSNPMLVVSDDPYQPRKFVWWRLFWQKQPSYTGPYVSAATLNDFRNLSLSEIADAFEKTYL